MRPVDPAAGFVITMNAENRSSRSERGEQTVVLTARDRKIVYTVARFTLASTRHLTALFFTKKNTANKRLRALFNAGLLRAHLVLGSTSPTIYTLSPLGLKLLVGQMGVDRALIRVPRTLDVADLHHRVAIVDVRVAFVLATRETDDLRLVRFLVGGEVFGQMKNKGAQIVPDALILLSRAVRPEVYALEADLGTEPLSVWRRKVETYGRMMFTDVALLGERDWRVLVAAPGLGRLRSIAGVVIPNDRSDRFVFVDLGDICPRIVVDQTWITASALADVKAWSSLRRNANG
jgi:hypothetical protein